MEVRLKPQSLLDLSAAGLAPCPGPHGEPPPALPTPDFLGHRTAHPHLSFCSSGFNFVPETFTASKFTIQAPLRYYSGNPRVLSIWITFTPSQELSTPIVLESGLCMASLWTLPSWACSPRRARASGCKGTLVGRGSEQVEKHGRNAHSGDVNNKVPAVGLQGLAGTGGNWFKHRQLSRRKVRHVQARHCPSLQQSVIWSTLLCTGGAAEAQL